MEVLTLIGLPFPLSPLFALKNPLTPSDSSLKNLNLRRKKTKTQVLKKKKNNVFISSWIPSFPLEQSLACGQVFLFSLQNEGENRSDKTVVSFSLVIFVLGISGAARSTC